MKNQIMLITVISLCLSSCSFEKKDSVKVEQLVIDAFKNCALEVGKACVDLASAAENNKKWPLVYKQDPNIDVLEIYKRGAAYLKKECSEANVKSCRSAGHFYNNMGTATRQGTSPVYTPYLVTRLDPVTGKKLHRLVGLFQEAMFKTKNFRLHTSSPHATYLMPFRASGLETYCNLFPFRM